MASGARWSRWSAPSDSVNAQTATPPITTALRNRSRSASRDGIAASCYRKRFSGRLDDAADGLHHFFKLGDLQAELFASGGRQAVIARAAVVIGLAPFGRDPSFDEHALERRI